MSQNGSNGNHNGSGGSNGANGSGGSNGSSNGPVIALSAVRMELLRQALIEHGKKIGELERKMDQTLSQCLSTREMLEKVQDRLQKFAKTIGIQLDEQNKDDAGGIPEETK